MCSSPTTSVKAVITEKAIGSIIMAVAVFDIHMDKKAAANIKPNKIMIGLLPVRDRIFRAMRLCRFHFSSARAMMNPPIYRKMM